MVRTPKNIVLATKAIELTTAIPVAYAVFREEIIATIANSKPKGAVMLNIHDSVTMITISKMNKAAAVIIIFILRFQF